MVEYFKPFLDTLSSSLIPFFIGITVILGLWKKVPVYEEFVEGAKEGFEMAVKIIPYLVGMLVAIGVFRASGAMYLLEQILVWPAKLLNVPVEVLPMALMRPLSGSGAYGILASIINNPATGPDTYTGYLVSTFQGSTETTFYVLAVYFGAVQIRKIRHALISAITADIAGIIFAVIACAYLFGNL